MEKKTQKQLAAGILILTLLAILVYAKTANFGFVWDDEYYVVSNLALRSWSNIPAYLTDVETMSGESAPYPFPLFRPTRNFSYLVDFSLAGLNPAIWHWHNVLVHIINGLLLFLIAFYLLRRPWPALFAGAVFLVHPVQTEAVAWVKCRDDLLAGMFLLAAFGVWLVWCRGRLRPWRIALLSVLFLLACLSKIQAVIFPALIGLFEVWNGVKKSETDPAAETRRFGAAVPRINWFETLVVTAWLALLGFGCLVWRHLFIGQTAQSGYPGGTLWRTMLTMTRAAVDYLRLLVWPRTLVADYSGMSISTSLGDWRVLVSIAVLAAVVVWVLLWRKRWPLATFGTVWLGVCLLPVSNIVPMMQFMAERFLYLPIIGFALVLSSVMRRGEQRWPLAARSIAVLVIAVAAWRSYDRLDVWRSDLALHRATVADTPAAAKRPRRNLLVSLINTGQYDEALPLARSLYEAAQDESSDFSARQRAEHARHLAWILTQTGRAEEGQACYAAALAWDTTYVQPYLDLGLLAGMSGRHQEALDWFTKAVAVAPASPDAWFNYGIALRENGQFSAAETAFGEAIAHGYNGPAAHLTLAALLWKQQRFEEAAKTYQDGLVIWPENADLREWAGKLEELRKRLPVPSPPAASVPAVEP
jgi:tetratricopeptide (TPR) repeat protein